jgi:GSH-dependent disulfide-bond oxidoreductase
MIDLYGISSPNVLKVLIMLEETGLAYDLHRIDIWAADQFTDEFKLLNPNSKVPVIVDRDGADGHQVTVFESGAILFYLAEKARAFLPDAPQDRYATMQWLMLQMSTIGPMFGQATHFRISAPAGQEYALSRYTTEVHRLFDVLEARLSQSRYLGGEDYTIADIATWPWAAMYHEQNSVDLSAVPAVSRWIETVGARPAVVRAHQDWPTLVAFATERRASADLDNRDRYVRGPKS